MTEATKAAMPTDLAEVRRRSVREFPERGPPSFIRLAISADEAPVWWTPRRDQYLRKFWPTEPFLAGAVYSIASRNASYRLEFEGPPRQVAKAQRLFAEAELGTGYESMMLKISEDFLTQDNFAFMEVIRPARVRTKEFPSQYAEYDGIWLDAVKIGHKTVAGEIIPVWAAVLPEEIYELDGLDYDLKDSPVDLPIGLAHLDAGRCQRTGDPDFPVTYIDLKGATHKLSWWQVVTFEDLPSPIEDMRNVGYCFVSRVLRLAQTLRDIQILKNERAAGRFAGRIYLTNVGAEAVQDAIEESKEAADNRGLMRYMPPIIAATLEPGQVPGVATIDLASVPDGFSEEETLRWYIAGLALGGGTDYGFLAPLPGKGLGTASQSETQERQARGKSSRLFMKIFQHKFNYSGLLPKSVTVRFKETDLAEEAEKAASSKQRAETRALRIESGEITPQIARQMAADDGDLDQKYLELLGEADLTPEIVAGDADKPETDKPKVTPEAEIEAEPAPVEKPEEDEKGGPGSGWHGPPKGTHTGQARPKSREFTSFKEADGWGTSEWEEWQGTLTPREKDIIRGYSGDGYEEINEYLRKGTEPDLYWGDATMDVLGKRGGVDAILSGRVKVSDLADEFSEKLDTAISKGRVPADVTVYRGFGKGKALRALDVGDAFRDKSFSSTSLSESEGMGFLQKGGILAKIRIPAGTKCAYLDGLVPREVRHEAELLLSRGSNFKIVSKSMTGNFMTYEMELIT